MGVLANAFGAQHKQILQCGGCGVFAANPEFIAAAARPGLFTLVTEHIHMISPVNKTNPNKFTT